VDKKLDPDRLSFTHALRVIKRKMPQAAAFPPERLAFWRDQLLAEIASGRSISSRGKLNPRGVKRKLNPYRVRRRGEPRRKVWTSPSADLPVHAASGACPIAASTNQALTCLIRGPAIHGRRNL
jgi:hypothetical protein